MVLDGRYEILSQLGEGGMGAVYRARRVHLGDEVVIKVIQPSGDRPTERERFLRGAASPLSSATRTSSRSLISMSFRTAGRIS